MTHRKIPITALAAMLTFLAASCAHAAELKNIAPDAKVSATSESSPAIGAVDGRIPGVGAQTAEAGSVWVIDGPKTGNKADFVLEWKTPVEAGEVIYYGRVSWAIECFKDYEIYLDNATKPAASGTLEAKPGPQPIPFKKTKIRKLTIRFLNAQPKTPNAGAAEIIVLNDTPTPEELDHFLAFRPNSIFSRNMVLQREKNVPVWGWAADGDEITVEYRDQKETTVAKDGKWAVTLKPMPAGKPGDLTISSPNRTYRFDNVVGGEVWLCSGQSNMEFPLGPRVWPYRYSGAKDWQAEAKEANYPNIRFCFVARKATGSPQDDVACRAWQPCTPETAADITAIGYFFARDLYKALNVPIGIIDASWGATTIEPWMSRDGFNSLPSLQPSVPEIDHFAANYRTAVAASPNTMPPPVGQNQPTALYNGMIHPMIPFAIQGALWYQGEGNLGQGVLYRDKMEALIGGWRTAWKEGDFPFYYVQLAAFNYPGDPNRLPSVWEAQLQSLAIPNTGMAVITDVSELGNIHPTNKQAVGRRLALWALAKTYKKKVVCSGPLYKSFKREGNRIRITFDYTGGGMTTRDKKSLDSFEIAGPDGKFVPAKAQIDGKAVIVWSDNVPKAENVRFGWNKSAQPNLVNIEGLPASPFRTNPEAPPLKPPASSEESAPPAKSPDAHAK